MDIFDALNLVGGLALFLFGMTLMGQGLERRAGSGLRVIIGRLTGSRLKGLMTGLIVTSIIQSSSATTVMVVGFVNSGVMTLHQAISVIMGANIGTTVTAWILSLTGIESSNVFVQLLKPASFTPVLALIGIVLMMFSKKDKDKDTGLILLSFATLMTGMEAMSGAVSGLRDVPQFRQMFIMFKNPILGLLAGMVLTGIIQSSSASVGILQALAQTGQVSYGAAIPIIMGQNIGTTVTALISSVGTNKNARRAALVHTCFNIIGAALCLTVFCIVRALLHPVILDQAAGMVGIAVAHSIFNILCTAIMLPLSDFLERLVCRIVPDGEQPEINVKLDERLLGTPSMALERCAEMLSEMAADAGETVTQAIAMIDGYTEDGAAEIRSLEDKTDRYEDLISTYLVKLSTHRLSDYESAEAAEYLKLIGDFERMADHGLNVLESSEELRAHDMTFSEDAMRDYHVMTEAVREVTGLAYKAFANGDTKAAEDIEPLEEVIDGLKEDIRTRHIERLLKGNCSIEAGLILNDLITNLERIADHCSNVGACILDSRLHNMNAHENVRGYRTGSESFTERYREFENKYRLVTEKALGQT